VTHSELQELLGAYAIDAVEADEAVAVDAHLIECPRCRAEVAELREMAALLAHSGADAPDGVWDRISSSLSETPPPLRLEVPRDRKRLRNMIALAAAAAVIVVLAVSVQRLSTQVDDLKKANQSSTELALAADKAMTAPGARIARLTGSDGRAAVAVVQANGQGYFLGSSLPSLDHRIYQLWGATSSGQIASLGTIPGPGVYAFTADPSVHVVMVTEEDSPAPAPTSAAIATGTLA
jgi:anti-sigma factor RsiW